MKDDMDKYLTYATSAHRYSTDCSSPIQVMKGYTYAANRVLACNTDGRADNSGRSAFSCLVNALYAGAKLPKLSAVQLVADRPLTAQDRVSFIRDQSEVWRKPCQVTAFFFWVQRRKREPSKTHISFKEPKYLSKLMSKKKKQNYVTGDFQ